jgi:hypothetical protein
MASVGAKSGILLAIVGTLLPASLAAGVFLVTRISFEAINNGPINPARGTFTFQTEVDPAFVLTGPVGEFEPTSLAAVRLNFGAFTTDNVGVRCENESLPCIIPATIGGTLNGIGADHLGEVGIKPGTNDFELGLILQLSFSERTGTFSYRFADGRRGSAGGHYFRWCAAEVCIEGNENDPDDELTLEIQQFVTAAVSPD